MVGNLSSPHAPIQHHKACVFTACRWYLHISYPLFFNSVPFDQVYTPQVKTNVEIDSEMGRGGARMLMHWQGTGSAGRMRAALG